MPTAAREEVNREVRKFGVAVPRRIEHVRLKALAPHETDCFNAFNTVNRMPVLAEVATCLGTHSVCGQSL